MRKIIMGAIFSVWSLVAFAHNMSPVGKWQTVDDDGRKKAVVSIKQDLSGELRGTIIKLNEKPGAICNKCNGDKKDKPIEGMSIIWGLKKVGDHKWAEGFILDPSEGDVYKANVELIENGAKIKLRGFIGVSLFGRTQVWERIE